MHEGRYERYMRYHLKVLLSVPGYRDKLKITGCGGRTFPLVLYLTYSGLCLSPLPTFAKDVSSGKADNESIIMYVNDKEQYEILMSGDTEEIVEMLIEELQEN